MNIIRARQEFSRSKKIYDKALLRFEGTQGWDVYNCSIPFEWKGKSYIFGRVERREDFANSTSWLFPKRFPAAGNLGGDRQLRALAKKLSERGSRLYLTEDRLDLLSHRGVSVSHDTIYNIQNNPLYSGAFANAAYIESGYSADRDEYLAAETTVLLP